MELADGSFIFLAFLIVAFFGVVLGYFTEKGSGITVRAYAKNYSDAPASRHVGDASGHDAAVRIADWSRGTR